MGQRVFQATGSATTSYPNRYYNVASSSLTATTTKHIFSLDGTLLATVVGSGTTTATSTYLHPDHLGGTNIVTDEDGEVSQTFDYYPYGSQRVNSGSSAEQRRFIGEEFDGDTEFSYLNARYYQGSRGQFMSQDPVFVNFGVEKRSSTLLTDPQLQNAYAYSRNNPVAFKDPNGEFLFVPIVLTLALAGQLSYLYSTHQVVQILYSPTATPGEKSTARERFFANFAINGALMASGGGSGSLTGLKRAETLAEEGLPLLLDAMDYLYGDGVYKEIE
jgi:RHS repeat-associated protein